jgi:hypothetical protein
MTGDSAQLVNDAAPYVVSALSAYGGAVLAKTKEETADATDGVGRRLTRRIFGTRREGDPVPKFLADVIQDPSDAAYVGALRLAMRDALEADRGLADQVRAILAAGGAGVARSDAHQDEHLVGGEVARGTLT